MQEKYDVTGMTCAACQARVQKSVACLNGVQECNVNLLKNSIEQTKNHLAKYIAMRFFVRPKGFAKLRPRNAPPGRFRLAGRKARGTGCSNPFFYCPVKSAKNKKSSTP